jgi:putative phosphoesterase
VKGGHRIFLTHGHIYNVYSNSDRIAQLAKAYKADIAVYGHTHYPEIRRQDSVLVMNPGSLGYPRQAGHRPSYIILNIAEDGTADPGLRYVPEGRG